MLQLVPEVLHQTNVYYIKLTYSVIDVILFHNAIKYIRYNGVNMNRPYYICIWKFYNKTSNLYNWPIVTKAC